MPARYSSASPNKETVLRNLILASLVLVGLAGVPGLANAEDLKFTLTNHSSRAIENFYTSPANTTDWQEDVLGEDTIAPGQSDEITVADGSTQCIYDMRFIMDDKAELVEQAIDLCKLGEYTLSDAK